MVVGIRAVRGTTGMTSRMFSTIHLPPEDDVGDIEQDPHRGYYISEELGGLVLALRELVDTDILNVVVSVFKEPDENTSS